MNIEQAIEYWSEFHGEIEPLREHPDGNLVDWDEQEAATVIAIEALKRQIKVTSDPPGYCPRCGHRIFFQRQNYCIECGQAIRR